MSPSNLDSLRLRTEDDASLRDARGRLVLLRGVNVGGRSKRPPYMPFELRDPRDLSEVRAQAAWIFDRVASWGLNAVRLPFSWQALEPTRGAYDLGYLTNLRALLDAAGERGLRVILDLHQDLYAAPLGGNGMPDWALPEALRGERQDDHRLWFAQYMVDGRVAQAYDHLWSNSDGVLDALCRMWAWLLGELGDHRALVGVDLINEPGWGSHPLATFTRYVLSAFYERLITALRADHPSLLYLYGEPGVEMLALGDCAHRPLGDQIVYAPHLYDPGLLLWPDADMITTDVMRPLSKLARWSRESGTHVLIGELGVTYGARQGAQWLEHVASWLDRLRLSATVWEASRTSRLWHGEDLNLIGPDDRDRPAARAWARPYLGAAPGVVHEARWVEQWASWAASWEVEREAPALIYVPARLRRLMRVDSLTAGARLELPEREEDRGVLQVWGQVGERVSLRMTLASGR